MIKSIKYKNMKLGNIFKQADSSDISSISTNINANTSSNTNTEINWKQRGVNAAGLAQGKVIAYEANLTAEVGYMKKQQADDISKQESWKEELLNKKSEYETEIETKQNLLDAEDEKINNIQLEIQDLNAKKTKLATENKTNKNALVNFIIGLVIITGLTIYLFIFYSSTAYSAFFKEFGLDNTEIVSEMFDSQALSNALNDGATELLFILLIPTIFLGLGYVIHQFESKTQNKNEVKMNVIKIIALYLITFLFDCFLAYKISASMYEVLKAGSLEDSPSYTLSMASGNVDFWIVIFCGFVAYIIWGLVFSFVMKNYEDLHKNTSVINQINSNIQDLSNQIAKLKTNTTTLKNEIAKLKGEVKKIENSLSQGIVIDWNEIKTALSAFNQGWIAFMTLQNMPATEIEEVSNIYEKFIEGIN